MRQARGVFVDTVDVKAMFAVKRRSFTEQGGDFFGGFWVIIGVDRLPGNLPNLSVSRIGVDLSPDVRIIEGASGQDNKMLWLPMMKTLSVSNCRAIAFTVTMRSSMVLTSDFPVVTSSSADREKDLRPST
jgi:hypothetical protein